MVSIKFCRREASVLSDRFVKNKGLIYTIKDGVEFIQFSNLKKYENIINHAFTTRHGGVSKMNMNP